MEIEADGFSDEALEHLREGWSPSRFRVLHELRAEKLRAAPAVRDGSKRPAINRRGE